jgi:hypothetical protein
VRQIRFPRLSIADRLEVVPRAAAQSLDREAGERNKPHHRRAAQHTQRERQKWRSFVVLEIAPPRRRQISLIEPGAAGRCQVSERSFATTSLELGKIVLWLGAVRPGANNGDPVAADWTDDLRHPDSEGSRVAEFPGAAVQRVEQCDALLPGVRQYRGKPLPGAR